MERRVGLRRAETLLLGLLLLGWLALIAALRLPPWPSDQIHYFADAATLPVVTPGEEGVVAWHRALRLGLLLPVRLAQAALGYTEAAYYLVPFVASAGLLAGTYLLARRWFGPLGGLIAAALLVGNPLVLSETSQLLPDLPAAALLVATAVASAVAADRLRQDRTAVGWLVLAAGLLGWAWMVRETVVLWLPALAAVLVAVGLPWRRWWTLGAGLAAGLAVDLAWGAAFHDRALQRIVGALSRPDSPPWRQAQVADLREAGLLRDGPADLVLALPRGLLEAGPAGWLVLAGVLALLAIASWRRDRRLVAAAAWVGGGWLLVTVMILATDALLGTPLLRPANLRYWMPLWPLLAVGLAGALVGAGRPATVDRGEVPGPSALRAAPAVLVLILGVAAVATSGELVRNGNDAWRELRIWLAGPGTSCEVLWLDDDHWRASTLFAPMYVQTARGGLLWDGELRPLNEGTDFLDEVDLAGPGAAVLVSDLAVRRFELRGVPLPGYLADEPPPGWSTLLDAGPGDLEVRAPPGGCRPSEP